MIFLLLLIINFFVFTSWGIIQCITGPFCQMKLNFTDIVPSSKNLPSKCVIIESLSCSFLLRVDYMDQQVYIDFQNTSSPLIDLIQMNPLASIVLRYSVRIQPDERNKFQLLVLLQCRTNDRCSEKQLRHFWRQFISLTHRRREIYHDFYELLHPMKSTIPHCIDDRVNETIQCSISNNTCGASSDTLRQCTNDSTEFTYEYNKVYRPHRLTDEYVRYRLACHVNHCNNNQTIHRLSELARQFVENLPSSSAIKLYNSHFNVFSLRLLIIIISYGFFLFK